MTLQYKTLPGLLTLLLNQPYIFVTALALALSAVLAPKISVILLPTALFLCLLAQPRSLIKDLHKVVFLAPLFAFLSWAIISITWSITPLYALKSTGISLFLSLCTLSVSQFLSALSPKIKKQLIFLLTRTFFVSVALLTFELLTKGILFHLITTIKGNVSTSHDFLSAYKSTAFVVGPLSILLLGWYTSHKNKLLGASLLVLTFALVLTSHSSTASLSIFIGAGAFYVCLRFPHIIGWPMMFFFLILNTALPLIVYKLPISEWALRLYDRFGDSVFSFYHRTIIWEFSIQKWFEKPIIGWGAASSRAIPGGDVEFSKSAQVLSLHPHNHLFQAGLELGLVGTVLYTSLFLAFIWTIHTAYKSRHAKATAFALLVTIYVIGSGETSLWHHWWIAWIGIFTSMCILICSQIESSESD